jgi:hypothetical protein
MISSEEPRLPTHLWVEAEVRRLSGEGLGVYVAARGDKTGGMVIQKISDMNGLCRLRGQQRDLLGKLVWIDILQDEIVPENEADAYIKRAVDRDPDLWVVEIEDRAMLAAMSIEGR